MASIGLDKHDIRAQLMWKRTFPCSGVQTSLVKWLRGYQAKRFGSFSCAYFRSNSVILSTVGFINEGNYCHSQRIGQLIKEKLLKGIFKVDYWKHDQCKQQVSLCLILIYRRFSVQFVTTTRQFTLSESIGLIYKPHPRFGPLSKKVRLIHQSLWYSFPWEFTGLTMWEWKWPLMSGGAVEPYMYFSVRSLEP